MKTIEIKAQTRKDIGKNRINKYRSQGQIPAVIYGGESRNLFINQIDALKLYNLRHDNIMIKLSIDDKETKEALLKDYQLNPVKNNIIHLDFLELISGKSIIMKIPAELTGTPAGIKMGGIIEHFLWDITIECLPKDIPEKIVIDITNLNLGQSIHISDLKLPEGVRILDKPQQVIVTIGLPSGIAEEKEAEAAAAAEAEAAAAAAEGGEPGAEGAAAKEPGKAGDQKADHGKGEADKDKEKGKDKGKDKEKSKK